MKRFEPLVVLRDAVTRWDVLAFIVVIGLIVFLGETSRGLFAPLTALEATPISLDPWHLPEYAARTTFRMFAALALSLVFTLTYATWAAKSDRAGKLLVPILDILQSVPILGFISITVVFFMSLAPGRVLAHGADRAHRGSGILQALAVDALLAIGGSLRHAGAHLEHDDVDVGRLVLRRGVRVDQRGTHHGGAAGCGFLYCARHRAEEPGRHRLGDRDHGDRDSCL